jgi:hypothetical protein
MPYEDGPIGLLAAGSPLDTVPLLGDATVVGVLAMNAAVRILEGPLHNPPEWRAFLNPS